MWKLLVKNYETLPFFSSDVKLNAGLAWVLHLPLIFASGGQNPFYKKGFGFPKIFY
jgi:hypothetical protein